MISRRVALNLITFLIAALVLVLYGIVNLWGNPLDNPRKATAVFPSAGGLHTHFLVSLDGVPVGEVSGMKLKGDGVQVSMSFDKGTHIPAAVQARIIRSSAVGEQRIDLTPTGDGSGQLANHAVIPTATDAPVPPDVGQVLAAVNNLVGALPADDLNKLIHEASVGLSGRAADVRSIVDSLTTLSNAYLQHQDAFRQLLATSPTLLNGVAASGAQLQDSLVKTETLTKLLANRRFDLVKLLRDLSNLGTVGNDFLLTNRVNLTCILSDLADTTEFLQGANLTNLDIGLQTNTQFFGLVDKISPKGFARDLGLNAPTRDDQTWLRVRTLLPPPQPPASQYTTPLPVPPTKGGAACQNVYGTGVGPVTQGANYKPLYGAQLIQPTAAESWAPAANRTGPVAASTATPAVLGAPAHAARGSEAVSTGLLLLIGLASLGLLLFAVPYVRYRWRT